MIAPIVLVLYWIVLVSTLAATVALAALAWRRGTVSAIAAAAGTLGLSLLLASVPTPDPGFALHALIAILAIAAAVLGGGPAVSVVLDYTTRGSVTRGTHGGILQDGAEVLRGGTTIGVLERIALAGTLLAGFPEGLAVLVAIKGVGRFSELDGSATRERFIIGTLVSWVWAVGATGVALLVR